MFPMPRIVYSMASDGLIFKFLAKLMPKFKTPFVASIVTGVISGVLATIFDLNELVDMLSIGTLMAYTLVSLCVLILRYKPVAIKEKKKDSSELTKIEKTATFFFGDSNQPALKRLFKSNETEANLADYRLVITLTFLSGKLIYIYWFMNFLF